MDSAFSLCSHSAEQQATSQQGDKESVTVTAPVVHERLWNSRPWPFVAITDIMLFIYKDIHRPFSLNLSFHLFLLLSLPHSTSFRAERKKLPATNKKMWWILPVMVECSRDETVNNDDSGPTLKGMIGSPPPLVHCSSRKCKWLILCAKKCNSVCNFVPLCVLLNTAHISRFITFLFVCVWIQLLPCERRLWGSQDSNKQNQTKWIIYKWSSQSHKAVRVLWESFANFDVFLLPPLPPRIYFLLFSTAGGFCLWQSWEAGQCLLRMCNIRPNWLNPARRRSGNMNLPCRPPPPVPLHP